MTLSAEDETSYSAILDSLTDVVGGMNEGTTTGKSKRRLFESDLGFELQSNPRHEPNKKDEEHKDSDNDLVQREGISPVKAENQNALPPRPADSEYRERLAAAMHAQDKRYRSMLISEVAREDWSAVQESIVNLARYDHTRSLSEAYLQLTSINALIGLREDPDLSGLVGDKRFPDVSSEQWAQLLLTRANLINDCSEQMDVLRAKNKESAQTDKGSGRTDLIGDTKPQVGEPSTIDPKVVDQADTQKGLETMEKKEPGLSSSIIGQSKEPASNTDGKDVGHSEGKVHEGEIHIN